MKTLLFISIIIGFTAFSYAQPKQDVEKSGDPAFLGYLVKATIINGDTIPTFDFSEVRVVEAMVFKSKRQAEKFDKLKRDVKKAYPYAMLASVKLKEYEAKLATIPLEADRIHESRDVSRQHFSPSESKH